MTRKLVLRSEHVAELTTTELGSVVAGAQTKDCPDHTYYCITGYAICGRLSIRAC